MKKYIKKNSEGTDPNTTAFKLFEFIQKKKSYVTVLSCLVVFITTYLLILPAITLDKDEADKQGGIDIQTQQEQLEDIPVKDPDANAKASDSDKIVLETEQDVESGDILYSGKGFEVSADCTGAGLPEGTELVAEEINKSDKSYDGLYEDALKAVQKDGDNIVSDFAFAKFYDISLLSDGEAIEPDNPLNVKISFDKGLKASDAKNVRIVHFAVDEKTGEATAEVLDPDTVDAKIKSGKMTEATFAAESFSIYAVVYAAAQINEDFITASGEKYEVAVAYDENAEIPEGATLEITEFAKGSKDYQVARETVIDKMKSEFPDFDDSEIGVAAFDLSILDKEGKQVEPKAAVDVSMIIKRLPEEAVEAGAQNSIEIQHLDESSGDIKVETVASAVGGNIQIEDKTAQAEFQLESFSTFTVSWNRRGTNNNSITFGWADGSGPNNSGTSRGYVTALYTDESGNPITRPDGVNVNIRHYNFNNGVTDNYNIRNDFARPIQNYSFSGAYVNVKGAKKEVDTVSATRSGDVTTVTYYYNGQEVLSKSYDASNDQNKRHDFTPDGLGLTLVYTKNSDYTTVHYGYMEGGRFVEFDEQPNPTNTSTSFGWAHLIYDFTGKDDKGLPVDWKYKGAYYWTSPTANPEGQGGTAISPILRYSNINNTNAWRYYTGTTDTYGPFRENNNWHTVANGSDIYIVYEKPTIPTGGSPTLSPSATPPDEPHILKESVSNTDGTNTLSLSVTGSRAPMVADKVADVIVILDLSSSMRRDIGSNTAYDNDYQTNPNSRYYQAKKAVQDLADYLYAENGTAGQKYRMGLVTFSNKATVRQTPTSDRAEFQSVLDGITAYEGSGTNWEHSLQLANQMSVASDRATYIVFITDGEPSVRQTRGNLTNEQLSGVNNTNNPASEGDIFHGGRTGGRFFADNGDHNTPDFRDYFGSATFGGLMNNDVWDERNRNAGVDEVASIVGHNKGFYAIGVSSDVNKLGDFVEAGGVDADHYKLVKEASAFTEVINSIIADLNGMTGQADVKIYDGITGLTQTISKVNQLEENRLQGVDGNFVYYKSEAPEGWSTWTAAQKAAYAKGVEYADKSGTPSEYSSYTQDEFDAYNKGKSISFSEWSDDARRADGCADAKYNTATGAVEWNMGEKFMLEDGVTYKVSFICWPSQQAYDIIAKLENGTITFGDTTKYPQEVWNQFEEVADNVYRLKTNEEGANTKYKAATSVSGNVTTTGNDLEKFFQHVPPMPLEKDKLNVAKTWQASRIDSQDPESVVLQVVGGNELYKEFEIEPTEKVGGSATNNYARSEDIYISCGHLKVNKGTGKVVVYESGHDFTLREVEENSRHWDLDASVCRPMKINTKPTMLVLVTGNDVPAGMTSDKDYYASGNDEYYRIDGKVYKDTKAWADITGMNTRRSFLDLSKEVLVDNQVWTDEVDTKFTYRIKIDIDPTTLSWDPDIEKYIIISIRGNGYSPAAAIADETYPTTAVLPSQSGLDSSLINEGDDDRYLVAESGQEFFLSIRNGWSVRFLNLPAGTSYSIEEVLPAESDYTFDNVRLETRKDNTSQNPDTTRTYSSKTIQSDISETSTLYKVVYQNKSKDQTVRILKTSQDASKPLGGAKFDLYTQKAYTASQQGTPLKTNLVSSSETATKGQIELGSLPVGVYYLEETEAPPGYIKRTDPVIITVSAKGVTYEDGTTSSQSGLGISQIDDIYQLTVTNDSGASLPNSGGPGTTWIYLIGSLLLLGCGISLVARRRTEKSLPLSK